MLFVFVLVILIVVVGLIRRHYQQYAYGLRERPQYFFWFLTCIIRWKGWSSESYCLRTDDLLSNDQSGYLTEQDVPLRNRLRPMILRGVPHRQLTQQAPDDIMHEMDKYMTSISIPRYAGKTLNNELLLRGKSVVEYTGADALFLPNASQKTFDKGEIAHLHSNDGSFHMKLHPSDAKLLIERQWAERFPLAGLNLYGRIEIPHTYSLIYAPETSTDLEIWKTILRAAIRYARETRHSF
jgi:hypothetical protein